jgi:hypothetical protein
MQTSKFQKQSTFTYTGKEAGTAKDNTYVYVASFAVDYGSMTEELAAQAVTQALPGCEVSMVRANDRWWRGWGKLKVTRWSEELHTALASGGARTRTEVGLKDADAVGDQQLRVRFEVYTQEDGIDENAFKVRTKDTDGKAIAAYMKSMKDDGQPVLQARRATYHDYDAENFVVEGEGKDIWFLWASDLKQSVQAYVDLKLEAVRRQRDRGYGERQAGVAGRAEPVPARRRQDDRL